MSGETVSCRECGDVFVGARRQARAAHWEPYSNRTQWHLDQGPMVCPDCVTAAIDACLEAARAFAQERYQSDLSRFRMMHRSPSRMS